MPALTFALTLCTGLFACDSGSDEKSEAPAKSAEDLDDEKIICCEFGGATGTSTEKKCVESKGKVVDKTPPKCA